MKKIIQVAIADNQLLFREGLKSILRQEENIKIVGLASDSSGLIDIIETAHPDIVILDTNLKGLNAYLLTKQIRLMNPNIGVIAMSSTDSEYQILQMLEAGVRAYLMKNVSLRDLQEAISKVYEKKAHYCSEISQKIISIFENENFNSQPIIKKRFTSKENEIIKLICEEYGSKEIAAKLSINSRCVDSTRKRIQEKIGCKNMAGIVKYAIKNVIYALD